MIRNWPEEASLNCCPSSGGVHNWLFCTARVLHCYRPSEEIEALLEAVSHGCGRNLSHPREFQDTVRNSKACEYVPEQSSRVRATSFMGLMRPFCLIAPLKGGPSATRRPWMLSALTAWWLTVLWKAARVLMAEADCSKSTADDLLS